MPRVKEDMDDTKTQGDTKIMEASDLDLLECGCGEPHTEDYPMVLHGLCHPMDYSFVQYFGGVLTVRCDRCKSVICKIAVKDSKGDESGRS